MGMWAHWVLSSDSLGIRSFGIESIAESLEEVMVHD